MTNLYTTVKKAGQRTAFVFIFIFSFFSGFISTAQTVTITGTPQQTANVSPGFRNRVLYQLRVDVTGGTATMTGISGMSTIGNYQTSDITAGAGNRGFRVWYYSNAGAGGTPSFVNGVNNLENIRTDGSVRLTVAGASSGGGQAIGGTFSSPLSLPAGIHWLFITADISPSATLNRTLGLAGFTQAAFQFSGTPTVTAANFPAAGLQTFRNATVTLTAATPVTANVERGLIHLQLYRIDVTASGAATQLGDGNGTALLSFAVDGSGLSTSNFNQFRVIYSTDNVLDQSDQQVGNALGMGTVNASQTASTVNVGDLPLGIPEGSTRSLFITTNTQAAATSGAAVRIVSFAGNLPAGSSFVPGSAPSNLPAGGLQTIGASIANVSLAGFRNGEATVLQGVANNVLGGIKVSVTDGTTILTRLSFNVPGTFAPSDYSALKLWASDDETFNPSNAVLLRTWTTGVSPNNQLTYDFPVISQISTTPKCFPYFTAGRSRYFFFTVDVAPTAVTGRTIGLSFNATNASAANTIIPGNRTVITPTDPIPTISINPQITVTSVSNAVLNLPRGAANQVLYKLRLQAANTNATLNTVDYHLTTTDYADIEGGYRLYAGNSATLNVADAAPLGSAVPSSTNTQTAHFVPATPLTIVPGADTYLFLVANTRNAAPLGNTVTVAAPTASDVVFAQGVKTVATTAVTHTISGPPQISLTDIPVATENIGSGTKDVVLYQLNMQVAVADADFSSVLFKTVPTGFTSGDATNYRLYFSADGVFDKAVDEQIGAAIVGTGTDQELLFTAAIAKRIELGATATLFLIADVPSHAQAGNTVGIAAPSASQVFFILGDVTGNPQPGAVKTVVTPPVVTVSTASPVQTTVSAGTKNTVLYKAAIANQPSAYINLLGVSLTTKASFEATDISGGLRIYLSTDDVLETGTDRLLGTTTLATTPATVRLQVAQPVKIEAGSTVYLFVVADVSPYAKQGRQLQLEPLSLSQLLFESSMNNGTPQEGDVAIIGSRTATAFPFLTPGASSLPCTAPNTPATLPGKVLNITQAPFNADPTGVQDATAAFRMAVSQNNSFVYIPNGTYRFTDSVGWRPEPSGTKGFGGANIQLWGESREGVILKLDANATGFGNPVQPKAFLNTGEDAPERFNNSLHNLTIEVGPGNSGAIGIRHYCNNFGGMYNVTVRSADGNGIAGIDKAYSRANGPSLLKDILVEGFDVGIQTDYSVESEVLEHITLRNQKKFGFYNYKQVVTLRDLVVENCAGPALVNESGHVVLVDGYLQGSGEGAIQNGETGKLLVRNLKTAGYQKAIADPQKPVAQASILEWTSEPVVGRQGISIGSTLKLPVKETPVIPWDAPSTWVNVEAFGATTDGNCAAPTACQPCDDDAPKIQAAIDATLPGGSRAGATTLFLPGTYRLHSSIRIRGSIRRIIGTGKIVASPYSGINPDGQPSPTNFIVEAGTYPEVVFENLQTGPSTTNGCLGCRGVTHFENSSGRTLIFKNVTIGSAVFNGGEVYFESISGQRDGLFTFNNATVYARQFNPERDAAKIEINGGTFWCLGLKTEGHGEIIVAKNKAKVELFGGFIYSLSDSRNEPMFDITDADVSLNFFEYNGRYGRPYLEIIRDTKAGSTAIIGRGADAPAFPAPQPAQVPTYPATWSQRNDGTTAFDGVVGSNIVLYINQGSLNMAPQFTLSNTVLEFLENDGAIRSVDNFATGISDGNEEAEQRLQFNLTTSNDDLFAQLPSLDPQTGRLQFATKPYAFGQAIVSVKLADDGSGVLPNVNASAEQTFAINILPVNAAPTLDAIADLTVPFNAPVQTVPLTGISAGVGELEQQLVVTAISSNPSLINPSVSYSSPSATGYLHFTPAGKKAGSALISVKVKDNGGTQNGSVDEVERSFTVTVQKGKQTIQFMQLANKVYGDAPFQLTATASSELPVLYAVSGPASLSGNLLTITGLGPVTLTATQPGDTNFEAASPVTQTFTVTTTDKEKGVKPILECVLNEGGGQYRAVFGYKNDMDMPVYIPVGITNYLTPATSNGQQVQYFNASVSGRFQNVFSIPFAAGSTVSWSVAGPDGKLRTATATSSSATCVSPASTILRSGEFVPDLMNPELPVKVYPNPANQRVVVQTSKALTKKALLRLYNSQGAIVYQGRLPAGKTVVEHRVGHLPAGMYLLKLEDEDLLFEQKLVIVH